MNRTRILSLACLLGLAATVSAQAACPIAGQYSVKGRMTGASGFYKGEALIKDEGGDCFVRWLPPNTSQGVGTYDGGVLTVNYTLGGSPGVVRYERAADGSLRGSFWPKGQPTHILGIETLTPVN